MYMLLTNEIPFDGQSDAEILKNIVSFRVFSFQQASWKPRSLAAMDLVKKLCEVDFERRISAEQAIEHEWIQKNAQYVVRKEAIQKALRSFMNFKSVQLLQKAVLNYMVSEVFTMKDKDNYLKLYYSVNRACNGLLTRNELLRAYWDNGFAKVSEIELDKILSFVD